MDEVTVQQYDADAPAFSARYEGADMSETQAMLLRHLPARARVLEIGCGSGRDAAFLVRHGYAVTGVDASAGMIAEATRLHPELAGRLQQAPLPFPPGHPALQEPYAGVVAVAVVMHIPEQDLFEAASQIRDALATGGILILSASIGRAGVVDGRDAQGRLFTERPATELQLLFERLGFRLVQAYENPDCFAREVRWYTLVMQRETGQAPRSVDEIETIITRDKKDATYKLALLRALCDIAQAEPHMVKWRPDGWVGVPLGLVAEKWLLYYWPIIEEDVVCGKWAAIPQKRGLETHKPIAFRRAVRELIDAYQPHGGLSGMYHDYKGGTVPAACLPHLAAAINKIAQTIVAGPVTYAGGALEGEGAYFAFEGARSAARRCVNPTATCSRLGQILVRAGTWREMCLIGHWVAESLVLRWAELTYEISNRTVAVKDVVDRLLVRPETERDVHMARTVYARIPDLRCVWTDVPLKNRFAVDHTVPFSIWHNNDLWNLLPAECWVNGQKTDKLVTKAHLLRSRDRVIHCWQLLRGVAENRFAVEVERSLMRGVWEPSNWEVLAFAGLVEQVETLALQRGLQRWEP